MTTDATPVADQGVSDVAREIGPSEHVNLNKDQGTPRDNVEDRAAANARRVEEGRLARLLGQTERQAAPEPEAPRETQAVDQDAGPPRTPDGRFAPKDAAEGEPKTAPTAPEPVALADDAMVKVKVNGKDQLMRWGDVRRGVQIEAAARQKMEAATNAQKEAQRLLEEARARAAAPSSPSPQTQPAQPEAGVADPLEELVDKLAYGDRDEIKSALAKFMQSGARPSQPPTVTPEALTSVVDQRLAAFQQEARAQSELQAFAAEHDDIVADEDMQVLVAQRAQRDMQQALIDIGADPSRVLALDSHTLGRAYREAEQVAAVPSVMQVFKAAAMNVKSKFAAPQPVAPTAIEQRLAHKQAMPTQPVAAAARAPAPPERRPPTASEIIAAERRERGLRMY